MFTTSHIYLVAYLYHSSMCRATVSMSPPSSRAPALPTFYTCCIQAGTGKAADSCGWVEATLSAPAVYSASNPDSLYLAVYSGAPVRELGEPPPLLAPPCPHPTPLRCVAPPLSHHHHALQLAVPLPLCNLLCLPRAPALLGAWHTFNDQSLHNLTTPYPRDSDCSSP